jgi:NADPH:quinone reductase-like Zn-dependent oxidoreductase
MDAAGIVESLGEDVERLRVGEEVMAAVSPRRPEGGAQAELLVVPAASVAPIPDGATLEQASTLPMNGLTALLGLELLGLQAGQTLGVTGGAGLLGSYVIVLAIQQGLRVIADAKPDDEALVRSFGADIVVPRGADFVGAVREAMPDGVDGLYDTALLHKAVFAAIADDGSMVVVRGWKPDESPWPGRALAGSAGVPPRGGHRGEQLSAAPRPLVARYPALGGSLRGRMIPVS